MLGLRVWWLGWGCAVWGGWWLGGGGAGVVAGVGGVGVAAGAAGGEGGFCAEEGGIIVVGLRAGWDGEGVVREAVEA